MSTANMNNNNRPCKILVVNSDENLEDQLFRVGKGTTLVLQPGPRCVLLDVSLKTNYPLKKNSKFVRDQYNELPIISDHQDLISSSLNWHASIQLDTSGTFRFVCSSKSVTNQPVESIWQAYVIVDPELKVPLNSIKCQTLLAKNLGPLSEWRQRLQMTKELKYNAIHLTPIQELGASNSSYSLRNQHKVNPLFGASLDEIKRELDFIDKKWGIITVTDIVLNHTADDSEWIRQHPECAYNMTNSPHLRPAFLLDCVFVWLANEMASGVLLKTDNLSEMITTEQDVLTIGILLKTFYVPQLKIYELFMINIGASVTQFNKLPRSQDDSLIVDYNLYERNSAKVVSVPKYIKTIREFQAALESENLRKRSELRDQLNYAVDNALNAIRYERLNPAGPYYRKPVVADKCPLVAPYFSHSQPAKFRIAQEEALMFSAGHQFMAHNGWVMGQTGTNDFAHSSSQAYLNREVIAWGDCIKLRYGRCANDVPYLWEHMRKYVEAQAKVFHGFRIDNCHSTPLHVAEFFIDAARCVRPDIYIMAELFTSSESIDNTYVNRLGLTALVRESMSAHNARELGRLMYRFGGTPVGAFYNQGGEHLRPAVARAIFYDQTHDNESPIVKRSAYDVPATTAIINMANCATGTTRGYDELVPHYIDVVAEKRLYSSAYDDSLGIVALRKLLNGLLRRELAQGFDEIFVDQVNEDVIAITRHNPTDGRSIVLVARTAFCHNPNQACHLAPISIQGNITRTLFEAQAYGDPHKFEPSDTHINGLAAFKIKIFNQNCAPNATKLATLANLAQTDKAEIQLNEFQFLPSSVVAVEVSLSERQIGALKLVNSWQADLTELDLTLGDINHILFRCSHEDGQEPYALPNFCKFTYAGLYGLMYHLERVRRNQDQAHPLAMNLRHGNWLSQYIVGRLRKRDSTKPLAEHLNVALEHVDMLPRGMVPKYFDLIVTKLYEALVGTLYPRMSVFVSKGPRLVKLLALSSVALVGECESAPMPPVEGLKLAYSPSIAAGLPHFASGYMRNWGRDTFIAMRGLLLITGRFGEAKSIILSFARTLKHGLIPNLLDGGLRSRYNCRDAVWWWLYSICEYAKLAPNGNEILRHKVQRMHRPETQQTRSVQRRRSVGQLNGHSNGNGKLHSTQQLCDIMQEALECHFNGMRFVEENAGKQLDEHMLEEGFTIEYGVDRNTGFVYGGNRYNCGTWMDKMGSSEKAKTRGLPASPRDGSAIEIVGLCKAVVSWLDGVSKNRAYPYDGVESLYDNTITLKWTWKKWSTVLQNNFEKCFYVPLESEHNSAPTAYRDLDTKLINRRGIYKDSFGASLAWQDYQLRPNFLVAMVVAPELFHAEHAKHAIRQARQHLCGPLGMRTLDPADWNYCGDYDNGNDSSEAKVAHGYNYHQGPEWLWLTGYYIRASSKFIGSDERAHHLQLLSNFYSNLVDSPWLGLPELTNSNGKFCPDSCPIQAWSVGCALEALHESTRG